MYELSTLEMVSKVEDLYYEFLYPKICIGAPIHLCALLFAGTAGALALCKFVRQDLYTEKVVRQKAHPVMLRRENSRCRCAVR